MAKVKFHIKFKDKRTTISVDVLLVGLMAVKLDKNPGSDEAYSVVREWLQMTLIDRMGDVSGARTSRAAQLYLTREIADKYMLEKYDDWYLEKFLSKTST